MRCWKPTRSYDDAGRRYGLDVVHSVTVDRALVGARLGGYAEYAATAGVRAGHAYIASFDTGITFMLRRDVQFDAGANFGLSDAADGVTVFAGVSFRR